MAVMQPFNPRWGSNKLLTANSSSQEQSIGGFCKSIHIENTGTTNPVYIRTGSSRNGTITATTADFRVSPGKIEVLTKPEDDDIIAYISAAGTTLEVIEGEGW